MMQNMKKLRIDHPTFYHCEVVILETPSKIQCNILQTRWGVQNKPQLTKVTNTQMRANTMESIIVLSKARTTYHI